MSLIMCLPSKAQSEVMGYLTIRRGTSLSALSKKANQIWGELNRFVFPKKHEIRQIYATVQSKFLSEPPNITNIIMVYTGDVNVPDLLIDGCFNYLSGPGSIVNEYLDVTDLQRDLARSTFANQMDQIPTFLLRGIGGIRAYVNMPQQKYIRAVNMFINFAGVSISDFPCIKKGINCHGHAFFAFYYSTRSGEALITVIYREQLNNLYVFSGGYSIEKGFNLFSSGYRCKLLPCDEKSLTQLCEGSHPHFSLREPDWKVTSALKPIGGLKKTHSSSSSSSPNANGLG